MKKSIKNEIEESTRGIIGLHKSIMKKTETITEEIDVIKKDISKLIKNYDDKKVRITLIRHFCLLSELSGSISFNEMIKVREEFLKYFPEHFKSYLEHLTSRSWKIEWSKCLGCRHFSNLCNLGITPREEHHEGLVIKICPSFIKRKKGM
ncbi:MAG: hypothetical protein KAS39_00280 [Actinomycetia bacterium]|nr:hypothetical protein [Actinomycetes bacterium]